MANIFTKAWDAVSGGDNIKKGTKKAVKREKENVKIGETQTAEAKANDAKVQAQLDTSLTGQKNALAGASTSQQAALKAANTSAQGAIASGGAQAQGVLGADLAGQHGLYDPQVAYGNGGIGLMEGAFGEGTPEQNQAFMDRFTGSPLYQATHDDAMALALRGTTFAGSANSGVNSGGVLRELADRGGQIGRSTIQGYLAQLQERLGYGRSATDAASGAYGGNALQRASAYNQTGANSASAYQHYGDASGAGYADTGRLQAAAYGDAATNNLTRNNQLNNAAAVGYGTQTGANSSIGSTQLAGQLGLAANKSGFWSGSAKLAGQILGGPSGGDNGQTVGGKMLTMMG